MKVSVRPISKTNNRLRIRWKYQGKDYDLRPGLPDTKQNRGYCEAIANKIKGDCLLGQFDDTLKRYRPWTIGHDHQCQRIPELFEKFTQAMKREKDLYEGSLRRYRSAASHLKRLDIEAHELTEKKALNFTAQLSEHCSNRTVKEYLILYRACFSWAKGRYEVSQDNPWQTPLSRVNPHFKPKVQPFTSEEVSLIIKAMKAHKDYGFYADFTAFLFGIGCRPGEAIALQWKHIDPSFKTIWIGQAYSHGELKCTKTGKARTVQLSESMRVMLGDRHQRLKPNPDDLVFSAKSGNYLDFKSYRVRAWQTILKDCELFYRKPYVTRHSTISLALEAGADPVHIAEQTGHNLKTLLENYAHVIRPKSVFVEVG